MSGSKISEIGDHFIVGLSGTSLSERDTEVLRSLRPAGVILRAHNFAADKPYEEWLAAADALREAVCATTGRSTPIIALDHEGGRVHRVPPPLTSFPAARFYRTRAREVALAMAEELRSIGINFSFAPVADIDSNPDNPVIGTRAFGTTPEEVSAAAVCFFEGLTRGEIIAAGKHFPGHGDTRQDSHEELPILDLPLDALKSREFLPFRALAEAGVPVMLSAHIRFPSIDAKNPATLSPIFMRDLLRKELRFEGVAMSDDLDMKAIARNFSDDYVAEQSFLAGLDMLLFNHEPERALRVANLIEGCITKSPSFAAAFKESHQRVTAFLRTVKPHKAKILPADVFTRHKALAESCQ